MDDVERLLAYDEIRQLAIRYAVYLDARDIDGLVNLYVPDVRISSKLEGRAAMRGLLDTGLRTVGVTFLQVGNHLIDLADDGETATGVVYTRGEIQDGGPESNRWIIHLIQYHDTYTKHEGRWLFAANRRHELVAGYEHGENPLDLPPADWPANQTGTGTLPHRLDSWQQFWQR